METSIAISGGDILFLECSRDFPKSLCKNWGPLLADHHTSKYDRIGGAEAHNLTMLVSWEVFRWYYTKRYFADYEKYCAGIMSVPMPAALRPDRGHLALTAHSPQPSVQCVMCRMHGVQHSTTLDITCSALQKQSRCLAPIKNYFLLLFSSLAYAGSWPSCGMSCAEMLRIELQTIHRFLTFKTMLNWHLNT